MSELYVLAAGVITALVTFAGLIWKAYSAGRDREKLERMKDDAQLQMEFDKIDSQRPSVDDALARLRDRGARSGSSPK